MLPSDFSTARTSARSIMHELVAQKIKRMQMRHHRETGNAWSAETENGGEGRGGRNLIIKLFHSLETIVAEE